MKSTLLDRAEKQLQARQTRRLRHKILAGLAALVIVCTACALMLPASTLEHQNTGLTQVKSADTKELITVNLYDYGTSINNKYNQNDKYPGFQQNLGVIDEHVGKEENQSLTNNNFFDFGNSITSDMGIGVTNITRNNANNINGIVVDGNGNADVCNRPISALHQVMKDTLVNGYPALADGSSLAYLFTNNAENSVTKKNTDNINGLFQYNEATGAYTFDSRKNTAQFNADKNTFTLYKELISSNFMMYPFGNFLPFNDITTQTKRSSEINGDYMRQVANSTNNAELKKYLNKFVDKMNDKYGTGWTAKDAAQAYFATSKYEIGSAAPTFQDSDFANIYTIDYDTPTDFFFGMEMEMEFMQPKGGMTGPLGDQQMVFNFTGDDDVWVYVDGVLFLDLSGIHRHVGGSIDFVNGKVYYYALNPKTGEVDTKNPYATKTFAEILGSNVSEVAGGLNAKGTFKDYSTHDFKFYYMERGSGSSVCRMEFNFPLLKKKSIVVSKELSENSNVQGNPDFYFQVLKGEPNGNKTDELFIEADTTFGIYENNELQDPGVITNENGVFTLKAGQKAVFGGISEDAGHYYVRELFDSNTTNQYEHITVDGEVSTKNNDGVTVGTSTFYNCDSPVKNINDGHATVFNYNNTVSTDKLGSLSISKQVLDYPQNTRSERTFSFSVTLDGKALPVGTAYTVGTDTKTVSTAGEITISAGQTATISNILAGSRFSVTETAQSAAGYTVSYRVDDATPTADQAIGIINTANTVAVQVTNSECGITAGVPITKTLLGSDGNEHTYQFKIEQVNSLTDLTPVANGHSETRNITLTSGNKGDMFTIDYATVDLEDAGELPLTYYYAISEVPNTTDTTTSYDDTVYVAAVTISEEYDGENPTGNIVATTALYQEGTLQTGTTATFTNAIQTDYTLPETGGPGTTLLYLLAAGLVTGALLAHRRTQA